MASLSQRVRGTSKTWEIRLRIGDRQKTIGLGSISKRNAEGVLRHVQELLAATKVNHRPDTATAEWLKSLASDSKLRDRLVELGLADAEVALKVDEKLRRLKPFLDHAISKMVGKARTINNYEQAARWLLKYFADDTKIATVTPSDLEQWGNFLKKSNLAYSNRRKLIQRAKKFFTIAVDHRVIDKSPATALRLESRPKTFRKQHFVDRQLTEEILQGLSEANYRLVFVLLRFQGLRRCEVDALRWEHILWDEKGMEIHSPKTGYRKCPIFIETLPYLQEAQQEAGRVVSWRGDVDSLTPLLRKRLIRVIGDQRMWPKTCTMLRSTRRTELDDLFPAHVVSDWLGHSTAVANEHYQQVTEAHWARAVEPHNDSPHTRARTRAHRASLTREQTSETQEKQGFPSKSVGRQVPRKGFEQSRDR